MAEAILLANQERQDVVTEEFYSEGAKNLNRSLLFASTYLLNNSGTKKVYVGLEYNNSAGEYQPIIELKNTQYSKGLRIGIDTWTELENKLEDISTYFKPRSDALCIQQQERIKIKNMDIILTTSYGMKSVMFVLQQQQEPLYYISKKKKKALMPSITMQKRTFDGLKNIVVCMNERYRRLERILTDINKCKNLLRDELADS